MNDMTNVGWVRFSGFGIRTGGMESDKNVFGLAREKFKMLLGG